MKKMKNALLVSTLAVGLALVGGSAYAADLGRPGVVEAAAPAGYYASVFGGVAFATSADGAYEGSEDSSFGLNGGYVIGGALGTHITPNLRGEVELSYASHGSNGIWNEEGDDETAAGSLNTLYVLGNLWYDINTASNFTPYLGGGAGFAVTMPDFTNLFGDGDDYAFTKSAFAPAAQVGFGVKFQLTDTMALDVGYRAKAVFNATWQEGGSDGERTTTASYIDQTAQAGLTIGF